MARAPMTPEQRWLKNLVKIRRGLDDVRTAKPGLPFLCRAVRLDDAAEFQRFATKAQAFADELHRPEEEL